MTQAVQLVALGAVVRAQGLRGELRIKPFNPDSVLLLEVDQIVLRKAGAEQVVQIKASRQHADVLLLTLSGVADRNAAEALRGSEVCVPRDVLPPLEDGEYYHCDVIGLPVRQPDGGQVGTVIAIDPYPTVDVLRVKTRGKNLEIPMLEPFLVDVDVQAGVVVVDHLDEIDAV